MNKVFVTWNPLHERIVCVHLNDDEQCEACINETEKLKDTSYFLETESFSLSTTIKEQAKNALINLLEEQIIQLTLMSKIELGDDVIEEVKRLRSIIDSENEADKDQIISSIKSRISAEYSKHKNLDWATIAAHKIYSEHFSKKQGDE